MRQASIRIRIFSTDKRIFNKLWRKTSTIKLISWRLPLSLKLTSCPNLYAKIGSIKIWRINWIAWTTSPCLKRRPKFKNSKSPFIKSANSIHKLMKSPRLYKAHWNLTHASATLSLKVTNLCQKSTKKVVKLPAISQANSKTSTKSKRSLTRSRCKESTINWSSVHSNQKLRIWTRSNSNLMKTQLILCQE